MTTVDREMYSYSFAMILFFFLWFLKEFFHRIFGMYPTIVENSHLNSLPQTAREVNYRLSKQLDQSGGYRIQIDGSIYLIKTIWKLLLLGIAVYQIFIDRSFYYRHFILFDRNTNNLLAYKYCCVILATVYPWELMIANYAKLSKATIAHHWVTSFVAMTILTNADYNPFATWYGFIVFLFSFSFSFSFSF